MPQNLEFVKHLGPYLNFCLAVCDHGFVFAESKGWDQPAETCSLILNCTLVVLSLISVNKTLFGTIFVNNLVGSGLVYFNPFQDNKNLTMSKLKAFADNKINVI